jgi:hypothetical protein
VKAKQPTTEIYVRVNDGLLERLERRQKDMSRDRPGAVITMSEVVRTGLIMWLDDDEE